MSWADRVRFSFEGGLAYRPGEVIVRAADAAEATAILQRRHGWNPPPVTKGADEPTDRRPLDGAFEKFENVADPLAAIGDLLSSDIYAQVNHVLFATPFYANPFYANPFYANPFYANPFYANPFYANPFYANPFYANPFYANTNPGFDPELRLTGERDSSARPADQPAYDANRPNPKTPSVVILDTGFADAPHQPPFIPNSLVGFDAEVPDGPDPDTFLDPVAGHGTFIAGIIEQIAPGCSIEVTKVIEPYGDGDEASVATAIDELAKRDHRPDLVNLSFGAYTPMKMEVLATAVAELHAKGTAIVASAGNDAIPFPMYPAAFEEVVGVAALAPDGTPARFTNYGPWVSACTFGVDIVSSFFVFDGGIGEDNPGAFNGWAKWSGTSFAAPRVVAALANHMRDKGVSAHQAVTDLIAGPVQDRHPLLGARIP